ncbi:MAG: bifunctional methylenetetrahydrofolate dehydrogenase/methenyltetrahydrofolate cyclohydrolase FolD [Bdellovibrionales bacterium]|nr:bifunctional methylenetetrahydrofolate dehydrogenase/methenyltetrahydrofolate cyclohydrolase FolD [Bdellovibrionales bacterium]
MLILDGKIVAQKKRLQIAQEIKDLQKKSLRPPGLGVILIGDDPASEVYVRNKILACAEVGIVSMEHRLPAQASQKEVANLIDQLNCENSVDGILLQLPLPAHLSSTELIRLIDPKKDVDGLTVENLGLFFSGQPRVVPCTPLGIIEILKHFQIEIAGKHAVVVGRSSTVGKPMALLLVQEQATVTLCHSKTPDLTPFTRDADIVVVAAGRAEFLNQKYFKAKTTIIDVGIHRKTNPYGKTQLVGDVDFTNVAPVVKAITPVPGGVGPMTIAMLLANTLQLYKLRQTL